MNLLLVLFLIVLPFQNVLVLGGYQVVRVFPILLGLAWLAGYLVDARNRGRVASFAPWLLGACLAASAIAIPFSVDPGMSAVRWARFGILWLAFAAAVPATLRDDVSWRRATVLYVAAGTMFGILNYHIFLFDPAALLREIAASPTRFVIRSEFAFGGGVEVHGHEVGHFTSFAILYGLALIVTGRTRQERWALVAMLVFASGALFVSFTKSAWAGLAVGLVVFYWSALRRTAMSGHVTRIARWLWVPVLAILVIGASFWFALPSQTKAWLIQNFLFRDVSGTERVVLWTRAVGIALDHPLVGTGLNSIRVLTGDPHNWWLEMLAEGGVLAFGFALAFFWRLWRELAPWDATIAPDLRMMRGAAAATVASIAFQGLFEASFLWDFPTWVALGLATALAGWPPSPASIGAAPTQPHTGVVSAR